MYLRRNDRDVSDGGDESLTSERAQFEPQTWRGLLRSEQKPLTRTNLSKPQPHTNTLSALQQFERCSTLKMQRCDSFCTYLGGTKSA